MSVDENPFVPDQLENPESIYGREWARDSDDPTRLCISQLRCPPRCCKSDRPPRFAARAERMGLEWLHTIRRLDLHLAGTCQRPPKSQTATTSEPTAPAGVAP